MKFLFLISFLLYNSLVFANEDIDNIKQIEPKELYFDYKSYPKRVFTGQKFDLKMSGMILKENTTYDKVVTTFTQEENIELITKNITWIKDKDGKYNTTVSFKVFDKQFTFPTATVALFKDEELIDFITIRPPIIKYEKIAINQKLFSNIIAKDLEIHTVKTKQYTNNILHTTINIKALNSNLENTYINSYKEQGVISLTQDYPSQNLFYYVMVPSHIKEINFTYYNTVAKDFIKIQIPIILEEELVSTQTDLNPYNSSMIIYKQVFSGVLLFLSVLLFLITKQDRYIIFITIFIVILAYLFIPNKKILIKEGVNVYILPTKNSTIYKKLEKKHIVEIINTKDNFIKVSFENKNIGWIKKNDI
ncbi:MAG: hypothetical protein U9R37_06775 [Campylobacterota bacterium]|nr:hypothetical protein [Campylobacterota bacterium]